LLIYYLALRRFPRLLWSADAFAWLWFTLAVVLRQLGGIWNVPVSLDFMARLFVIAVASWCWVFVRPVPRLGYEFSLSLRAVRSAALNFACFAAIAIPAAFAMRFAGWHPRWHGAMAFCLNYVEILVFVAWLEELFFRGFLQTCLSRLLRSDARGQLAASLAFGLSHILLAPAPNWRYVALASVAGWFYGSAFRQTGNLVAPALAHALVDSVWRTWFTAA
jgi:membrane protease YdiL (CAAX protease family)